MAKPLALRSLMLSIDSLTGKTTEVLLDESLSRDNVTGSMGAELKSLQHYGTGENSRAIPAESAANEMWDRMQAAERAATLEAA